MDLIGDKMNNSITLNQLVYWLPLMWKAAGKPIPRVVYWRSIARKMFNLGVRKDQLVPIFIELKKINTKSPKYLIDKNNEMTNWQRLFRIHYIRTHKV